MKILLPFLVVFVIALAPGFWVWSFAGGGPVVPFVVGSAAVSLTCSLGVATSARMPWYAQFALSSLGILALPFVAGGSTGFAIDLTAPWPEHTFLEGTRTGLAGAMFLYPVLVAAAAVAWVSALATRALAGRWLVRSPVTN